MSPEDLDDVQTPAFPGFLIVEDQEFQRRALKRILDGFNARQVIEAEDGQAALARLGDRGRDIEIVITDLDMPGMDGMEFLRHVGESGLSLSIIVLSALERPLLASIETMAAAYGVNLLGVMEKPLTPEKLERLMARYRPAPARPGRARADEPAFTLEEIGEALARGDFEPFFQPKIELETGHVRGAEALARWRHPVLGVISPGAFIRSMEGGGLIDELSWLMLKKASAACRAWRAAGWDHTVSVNLSLNSLAAGDIAGRVTEIVRGEDLEPRHVVLEITESAAVTDIGRVLENLARLRMKGFELSIDDYGTGYSSMQQLARIAFTELKIDQSFVVNSDRNESSRALIKSSIDVAKMLRIRSVAEGIEKEGDWNLLRNLGCDLAQGYFIAKPMEADAYFHWAECRRKPG